MKWFIINKKNINVNIKIIFLIKKKKKELKIINS